MSCLAGSASPDAKDRLIRWQAIQLHRLTGGTYETPDLDDEDEPVTSPPSRDVLSVVESVLWSEDIYRRPPRAAAPRLVERLAAAGLTIEETA